MGKLLRDLSDATEEQGVGVALLVDEAQDLPDDELIAVCTVVHAANQRQDRLVVGLAGLPSLPRKLAEAKSYAERLFGYHTVDALSQGEAAAALTDPAGPEGVAWHDDAVEHVVEAASGFPSSFSSSARTRGTLRRARP